MLLNFGGVNNDVYINIDGKLVVFQNVKITNVIENGKTYHKITIFNNGAIKERRRASRYIINKHCIASLGNHRKAVGATLRDVSSTGFSIITSEEIKDNDNTRVTFDTGVNARNGSAYLNGVVVRKEACENGKYLYGCKIITNSGNYYSFLEKYRKAN